MRPIVLVALCVFSLIGAGAGLAAGGPPLPPKDTVLPDFDRVSTIDLTGHTQEIGCAAFSRDGKLVATGCFDRKVRVFDISSGKLVHTVAFGDDVDSKPDEFGIRTQGLQNAVSF